LTADGLFNKIDKGLLKVTAAGYLNDCYYCAVRDMSGTVKGETLESAVFVIDLSQDNWKVETYPTNDIGAVFAQFTNSDGETNLYSGSFSNGTVYKMAVPGVYTDDDTTGTPHAVTATTLTKQYEYINKSTGVTKAVLTRQLWFKYSSSSTIQVSFAENGGSYTVLDTLPAYTSSMWTYGYIDVGSDTARTFGIKLTYTGNTIIYAIGINADLQEGDGIKGL
jgi:hypothetical protein